MYLDLIHYGENTNEHCFMKVSSTQTNLVFVLAKKLHNCYVDINVVYHHINRDFNFSSIRNCLLSSDFPEYRQLIKELYLSIDSHMSGEVPNNETLQTSSGLQGRNEKSYLLMFF